MNDPVMVDELNRESSSRFVHELIRLHRQIAPLKESQTDKDVFRKIVKSWRTAFDAIKDAICVLDTSGVILRCNRAFSELMGKPYKEIIGNDGFKMIYGDSNPLGRYSFLQMGMSRKKETVVAPIGGRLFETSVAPLIDGEGTILGTVHIMRSLSGKPAGEDSISFLRRVFKGIKDGICVTNRQMTILYVNSTMEKWHKNSLPLVGKKCYEVYHSSKKPVECCPSLRVIEQGTFQMSVIPLVSSCGAIRWYEIFAFPLMDSLGNVEKIVEYVRDITERKQFEEKLKEEQENLKHLVSKHEDEIIKSYKLLQQEIIERNNAEAALKDKVTFLQKLIDTIPNPIFYKNDQGLYQGCNTAFEEFIGLKKEDIIGKNVYDISPFDFAEQNQDIDFALLHRVGNFSYEGIIADGRDKERHILLNKATFCNADGSAAGLVGVILDLTERKQMERELARVERLNIIGEMAASIAHEIRNPMTTVRGFLQLYKEKGDLSGFDKHIELMLQELDRANAIISEFLSLARNKAICLKKGNLNSVIKALYPLLAADAILTDKNIRLKLKDIPDFKMDEAEIRQMILNLCRNGLEAMPPGGVLTVGTSVADKEITLSVRDKGKGIDRDMQGKIGTPFCTTKESGTGLGLAICYSIAARHNASISFKTGAKGTTFSVKFKLI